ncbi:MAG: tetratricopeptide repeat protein [Gammaproteobacteria bacterium]
MTHRTVSWRRNHCTNGRWPLKRRRSERSTRVLPALYSAQGRLREAEPLFLRSLRILRQTFGPDHPHLGRVMESYRSLLWEKRHRPDAKPI